MKWGVSRTYHLQCHPLGDVCESFGCPESGPYVSRRRYWGEKPGRSPIRLPRFDGVRGRTTDARRHCRAVRHRYASRRPCLNVDAFGVMTDRSLSWARLLPTVMGVPPSSSLAATAPAAGTASGSCFLDSDFTSPSPDSAARRHTRGAGANRRTCDRDDHGGGGERDGLDPVPVAGDARAGRGGDGARVRGEARAHTENSQGTHRTLPTRRAMGERPRRGEPNVTNPDSGSRHRAKAHCPATRWR